MKKFFVIPIIFVIIFSSGYAFNNFAVASPPSDDSQTECRDNMVLVYRAISSTYVCVSADTAKRWADYGLAVIIETEKAQKQEEKTTPAKETGTEMKGQESMKEKETMKGNATSSGQAMAEKEMIGENVSMLFVQTASSGTFAQKDGKYVLTLDGVSSQTVYFSDRPNRISGNMNTGDFVKEWTLGADSFADNPPNAAIVVIGADDSENNVVVELTSPIYDSEAMTLQYDAKVLKGDDNGDFFASNDGKIPGTFDDVSVFIDSSVHGGICVWKICVSGGGSVNP